MMKNRILKGLIVAAGFCLSINAANASDFIFVRPGDPDRIFKQDEALVIELPANLSGDELGSLFLELDGVDITQRITLEGVRAVFYPASPYGSGTHALRLVRMGRNGKLMEIERWSFNVAGGVPPVEMQSSVNGSADATVSLRAFDNYDQDLDEPDVGNFAGQTQIEAATQQGAWRVSLRGNGFLNSDEDLNPSGESLEVGEYLLKAENAGDTLLTKINLGSHDIGANNLLMQQFYRRGLSGTFDWLQGRASVTGFMMNPAAATGNRNFSGIEDGDQRVEGMHATLQPLPGLRDRLELEATAYRGEGGTDGSGAASAAGASRDGDGFQLGAKIGLIRDLLGMRTQYARTDFDRDGDLAALSSQRDEAYGLSFVLTPLRSGVDSKGRILQWEIEPGYYRAGSYFETMLAPSAEQDREIWSLKNRAVYGNLSLDGELSWIEDNVNKIDALPGNSSLQGWAQGSYVPETPLWGTPVFSFGGAFSDDRRQDTPTGYIGEDLDRATWSLNGGVVLSFEKTTWTFNHTLSELVDDVDTLTEYRSNYSDLGVEYRFSDRLTFRPGLQLEILNEDADGVSTAVHGSLGLQGIIIPDKFWNNSNYSMLLNNGDTPAGDTYRAETEFTWLFKPAEINSPGYALAVSGLYDNDTDTADTTDNEEENLAVFFRLKLSAPFAR